jgi:NTE family protein
VVLAAGRRPGRVRPGAVLAGLLPAGRISTAVIADGVDALFPGGWPSRPTWICAVRLDTGRLTVFGRDGAPPAGVGEAVAASCAIPGYFSPVVIDGVRYVDGGAHSTTNLASVAREQLDLVVVSAPMARAGTFPGMPPGIPAAIGAVGRELNRLQLGIEARRLRARGTPVIAFSPTLEDRAVMGLNPMDPGRRAPIARQARRSVLARLARPEVQELLVPLLGRGRAKPA